MRFVGRLSYLRSPLAPLVAAQQVPADELSAALDLPTLALPVASLAAQPEKQQGFAIGHLSDPPKLQAEIAPAMARY